MCDVTDDGQQEIQQQKKKKKKGHRHCPTADVSWPYLDPRAFSRFHRLIPRRRTLRGGAPFISTFQPRLNYLSGTKRPWTLHLSPILLNFLHFSGPRSNPLPGISDF